MNNIKFVTSDGTNLTVKVSQSKQAVNRMIGLSPSEAYFKALRMGWYHPRLAWAFKRPS
jgi:hypothetical protein